MNELVLVLVRSGKMVLDRAVFVLPAFFFFFFSLWLFFFLMYVRDGLEWVRWKNVRYVRSIVPADACMGWGVSGEQREKGFVG